VTYLHKEFLGEIKKKDRVTQKNEAKGKAVF
jgi:hypothetical protein